MRARRSGFSLVELVIALTVIALIALNVSMVLKTGSSAYGSATLDALVRDQAEQTVDRIANAVMSASADALTPQAVAPMSASKLDYQTSLGFENQKLVLSDPERIELTAGKNQVVWTQNPGLPQARSVVWANWIATTMAGELADNGVDDNRNGLVDEKGLSFDVQGKMVTIRLTITRKDAQGREFTKTLEQIVTCRN